MIDASWAEVGGERRLMVRVADERKKVLVAAHARLLMYYSDVYEPR